MAHSISDTVKNNTECLKEVAETVIVEDVEEMMEVAETVSDEQQNRGLKAAELSLARPSSFSKESASRQPSALIKSSHARKNSASPRAVQPPGVALPTICEGEVDKSTTVDERALGRRTNQMQ